MSQRRHALPHHLLAISVLTACLGVSLSACALFGTSTHPQAGQSAPVIQTPAASTTPTPGRFQYVVGAWPSNYTPAAGTSVTIYVAFRNGSDAVTGAAASLEAYYPGSHSLIAGPVATDRQGYAALTIPAGGPVSPAGKTNRTVQVTVSVSYRGQTYRATTNFTPL
jgi:hypothetical protein